MSEILRVLKNKNKLEKENSRRRSKEIRDMRDLAMYRNRLAEDIKMIELLLEDDDVESVVIKLGTERLLSMFQRFMYLEEFSEYVVQQVDKDKYNISRKVINI